MEVDEDEFLPAWEVIVRSPSGYERHIVMTNEQVRTFQGHNNPNPFAAALWIAYADQWGRDAT